MKSPPTIWRPSSRLSANPLKAGCRYWRAQPPADDAQFPAQACDLLLKRFRQLALGQFRIVRDRPHDLQAGGVIRGTHGLEAPRFAWGRRLACQRVEREDLGGRLSARHATALPG